MRWPRPARPPTGPFSNSSPLPPSGKVASQVPTPGGTVGAKRHSASLRARPAAQPPSASDPWESGSSKAPRLASSAALMLHGYFFKCPASAGHFDLEAAILQAVNLTSRLLLQSPASLCLSLRVAARPEEAPR
ncbi:hypothetical protein NDU88_001744 [Pleurodeles waltl]|uniref:Uncharacterized protein n=1 Tax=Pleurodeles waltl TaxID=8319 RepID=A0AAV7M0F3_PLEWA|nr:hypothetical protein NDU88_001744 [Pleurodeles waltl]